MTTTTIDEILLAVYNRGYVDGEPLAMYDKPNQFTRAEAKQALYDAMNEVIGEDEHEGDNDKGNCMICCEDDYCVHEIRNELRADQRIALDKLFGRSE